MLHKIFLYYLLIISGNTFSQSKDLPFNSNKTNSPILKFAYQELQNYLIVKSKHGENIKIHFEKDAKLKNGSFAYKIEKSESNYKLIFRGEDETCITHAVHSFLEQLGYRFEISGTVLPATVYLDTVTAGLYSFSPFTRWRGIRQHINFPMDISSYPIEEAKAYLDNLIRMRFNKIAVHSYPNLWHEVSTGDSIEYAGNFFYNREHAIPDYPLIKNNIRFNNTIFCIPAIEPFYTDRIKRSKMAIDWMKDLLNYAKSIGLRIQFSVEPRLRGDINYIVDNCRSAISNYPMIDELEINTEEIGGWGITCTDTTVKNILVNQFGTDVLKDTFVTNLIRKTQTDLDVLLSQVGRNIAALRIIEKDPWFIAKKIDYKLGIYCTMPTYANLAYHIVRKYKPETELTIMPGHGSVRSANHFSQIKTTQEDLAKTTIFSWIEFDGLMFTQQNPAEGIEKLMRYLASKQKGKQVNAVLFNHWRTAESRSGARFASLSALFGPQSTTDFYIDYAKDLGIGDPENYAGAMKLLERVDLLSTNDLPNVGFCWIGAWLQGGPYTWMSQPMLQRVRKMYDTIGITIDGLNKTVKNKRGIEYLSFLRNRIITSSLYLEAFEIATEIQKLKKDSAGTYGIYERNKAAAIINNSLLTYEKYMSVHAEMLTDRGTEGTLINLWHGPMYGLKVLRKNIALIPMDAPIKPETSTDAPPLPILIKNKGQGLE